LLGGKERKRDPKSNYGKILRSGGPVPRGKARGDGIHGRDRGGGGGGGGLEKRRDYPKQMQCGRDGGGRNRKRER